jgi:hypothetical protein
MGKSTTTAKRAKAFIESEDIFAKATKLKVKKGYSLVPSGGADTFNTREFSYHFSIETGFETITVFLTESVLESMLDAIDARKGPASYNAFDLKYATEDAS